VGKPSGLAAQQRRTLGDLTPLAEAHRLYLAGGGAVAYYVHHRQSLDLDLFSSDAHFDLAGFRDEVIGALTNVAVVGLTDATLRLDIAGTAVDVVRYPYGPLESPQPGPEGVRIAGLRDLGAMKLAAISQRGIRRDFWDLHEIVHHGVTLSQALDDYVARYRASHSDLYHVLRALTYFDDAERDTVMPTGLTRKHWQTIRGYFEHTAPKELLRRVGS
jgi:hypothetical protein